MAASENEFLKILMSEKYLKNAHCSLSTNADPHSVLNYTLCRKTVANLTNRKYYVFKNV